MPTVPALAVIGEWRRSFAPADCTPLGVGEVSFLLHDKLALVASLQLA